MPALFPDQISDPGFDDIFKDPLHANIVSIAVGLLPCFVI